MVSDGLLCDLQNFKCCLLGCIERIAIAQPIPVNSEADLRPLARQQLTEIKEWILIKDEAQMPSGARRGTRIPRG